MLQYKIPQDVQLEDKILGPLTLKQLIMVAVGGGLSYGIFLIVSERYYLGIIDYFWIVIPALISLAFAFIRLNDVSFLKWLMLLYEYGHNSRRRRWDKNETARLHFAFVTSKAGNETTKKKANPKKSAVPGKKKFSSLEELTYVLDHSTKFPDAAAAPDDHEAEYALHLNAADKEKHEKRLEDLLKTPVSPAAASAAPVANNRAPVAPAEVISAPSAAAPAPAAASPNGKAVDMIHQTAPAEQRITFEDLQRGGSVSFS